MTGGSANEHGEVAEKIIACILSERGYVVHRHHPIGDSIYGHKLKCDFFISNVTGFPSGLIIESKWQDRNGSVDEKYPYLVLNIKEKYPCPAIIVIGGGGAKHGATKWLLKQTGSKLIGVYSVEEFISYVNRELPEPDGELP